MIYSQSTGILWAANGEIIHTGYSGYGTGKNNPKKQHIESLGPIPRGQWLMTEVYDSKKVGPFAIKLEPVGHDALGRTDFRIHGDSISSPGEASRGCPIFNRAIRETIWNSGDRVFQVIE